MGIEVKLALGVAETDPQNSDQDICNNEKTSKHLFRGLSHFRGHYKFNLSYYDRFSLLKIIGVEFYKNHSSWQGRWQVDFEVVLTL